MVQLPKATPTKPRKPRAPRPVALVPVTAETVGGVFVLRLPIQLKSEGNLRDHPMAVYRRKRGQKDVTTACLQTQTSGAIRAHRSSEQPGWEVELVRITPHAADTRKLDGDNVQSSLKFVRDAVATWLRVDDGDVGRVRWRYSKRAEGQLFGCELRIRPVTSHTWTIAREGGA